MEHYIKQLIEDLLEAAKNPPPKPYIEKPPHLADHPDIAELALAPFQTIEELTGIKQEAFPEMDDLQGDQWQRVNKAIFKVFKSLYIELIDMPPDIPPDCLYEVLTTNWQAEVQYLPSSGMDFELCTNDPMTCPYGDYCDCGEEFDIYELPEKFASVINPIAQSIDAGFSCFLNPETLEMEDVPKMLIDNSHEFEMLTRHSADEEELKHESWQEYYTFEPLDSHESFLIMQNFTENLNDEILREELFDALNNKSPFANFKRVIDKRELSGHWFPYKMEYLEDHVKQIIYSEIHENKENHDDIDIPF